MCNLNFPPLSLQQSNTALHGRPTNGCAALQLCPSYSPGLGQFVKESSPFGMYRTDERPTGFSLHCIVSICIISPRPTERKYQFFARTKVAPANDVGLVRLLPLFEAIDVELCILVRGPTHVSVGRWTKEDFNYMNSIRTNFRNTCFNAQL